MQVLVDWAGPWKHEWQTMAALGYTLASPLIADFIASSGGKKPSPALEGEGAPPQVTHQDDEKEEGETSRFAEQEDAGPQRGDGANGVQRDGGGSSS